MIRSLALTGEIMHSGAPTSASAFATLALAQRQANAKNRLRATEWVPGYR